ncbi:hypothetical protein SAMN02927921_00541 [Sinomicrobium oceani]|uniref:Uncharacterized protein n=1 Tax=Sinomicrobium oceani TaxID=1150368 RepID=A0A1K1MBE4_9FLAO|nr:hypothetical protein [Sinomicrobium oceani]SFW20482.1 hypothetical protein SAMN02927921_00541 [Sinomicrobium oceani]
MKSTFFSLATLAFVCGLLFVNKINNTDSITFMDKYNKNLRPPTNGIIDSSNNTYVFIDKKDVVVPPNGIISYTDEIYVLIDKKDVIVPPNGIIG